MWSFFCKPGSSEMGEHFFSSVMPFCCTSAFAVTPPVSLFHCVALSDWYMGLQTLAVLLVGIVTLELLQ